MVPIMFTLIVTIHLLVSLVLVVVVLLQSGSGGGLASAFGGAGGSDAVFGGRGAATFLSKFTTVLGTVFFLTSLMLALTSTTRMTAGAAPSSRGQIREPQPFNPEAQILIESAEPPAATEGAEGVPAEAPAAETPAP